MHLAVDNTKSPRFQILKNMESLGGKECAAWFAIRNIVPILDACTAFQDLVKEGIILERAITIPILIGKLEEPLELQRREQTISYYRLAPLYNVPLELPKELRPLKIV